jgi:hypothetical protein
VSAEPIRPYDPEPGSVESTLQFVGLHEFTSSTEDTAEALLGADDAPAIPAGGTVMVYGDGGAGKTTLEFDAAMHLASGRDWLGMPVPRPVRIALIENEGPRGPFRAKLARKLAGWPDPQAADNIHVLEKPWAEFSLANGDHLQALRAFVEACEIDLLMLGPVASSGLTGAGTPDDIEEHARKLAALRHELTRPLAVWLVHHENKQGDVSGAWDRLPDLFIHVRAVDGGGRTIVHWRKARFASSIHGTKAELRWTDNEGFELVDAEAKAAGRERDLANALEWIFEHVTDHPGSARSTVEQAFADAHDGKGRNLARAAIDRDLNTAGTGEQHNLLTTAPGRAANGVYLYPASAHSSPLAAPLFGEHGDQSPPVPQTPSERECSPLAGGLKEEGPPAASSERGHPSTNGHLIEEDDLERLAEQLLRDHADAGEGAA